MLSLRITLLACLFSISAIGQELLFQESFEAPSSSYTANTFESGCDFFGRYNSFPDNGCFFEPITGLDGSFMWAAKDVGSFVAQGLMDFEPIDISSYTLLSTSIKLGVTRDGLQFYTSIETIHIEYSIDGGPYLVCGLFTGNEFEFGEMAQDLDESYDSFGPFGLVLNDEMQEFNLPIEGTGSELRLRIRVNQNFATSEFGFDDIRIFGVLSNAGCTDPLACNFDSEATVDDGSCTYTGYFIPITPDAGPALQACFAPAGYIFGDQDCIESVLDDDSACSSANWSSDCDQAYRDCLGCEEPVIYIPEEVGSGPAVFGCGYPPPGYIIPIQFCAFSVVLDDNYCLTDFWDGICQDAYEEICYGCPQAGCTDPTACNFDSDALCDDQSCIINEQYYIPIIPNTGPMVIACEAPSGYVLASRNCAMAIAEIDPFCLVDTWDFICQNQYIDCLQGEFDGFGCTYEDAQNFSPIASIDDGSCIFETSDSCTGDFNGDSVINTSDLSTFLSVYGTSCP